MSTNYYSKNNISRHHIRYTAIIISVDREEITCLHKVTDDQNFKCNAIMLLTAFILWNFEVIGLTFTSYVVLQLLYWVTCKELHNSHTYSSFQPYFTHTQKAHDWDPHRRLNGEALQDQLLLTHLISVVLQDSSSSPVTLLAASWRPFD